jgi:dienelactone hydrolase
MPVERFEYAAGQLRMNGALVYGPGCSADAPLILLSPNWLGVTPQAITQAESIAGDNRIVFVADMYGNGQTAAGPPEAAPLADALRIDWQERRRRITAAYDAMLDAAQKRGIGDPVKTAAIGFCFGGGNVLELARAGGSARAVVSLHGDLTTYAPARKGEVSAALLILHGSADPVAPKEHRDALEAEMEAAGASWRMLTFGGVLHSFAEESPPVPGVAEYDEQATHDSWIMIETFLKRAWENNR